MCGIAVVSAPDEADRHRLLCRLLSDLEHRGQPSHRYEIGDLPSWRIRLGTNRLAIVAPQCGKQPMTSPLGHYQLAFNGEVFNHRELAAALWASGGYGGAPPDSDTGVLAAAIEHWGPVAAMRKLAWEGAFVCVDLRDGTLWAGRDHLGIKPLYHTRTGHTQMWASEIKALVAHADGEISPVPPGTVVRYPYGQDEPPEIFTWWRPEDQPEVHGPDDNVDKIVDRLLSLVCNAVRVRVPQESYAVALSGGVDSSLVLRLAQEVNPRVTAYTLSRPDSPDLPYAIDLCRMLGVTLVEVPAPTPEQLARQLPEVIRAVETWEWHVINHAAPMLALMSTIRRDGHRVVLTGEGADELFCGYGPPDPTPDPADVRAERLDRIRHLHRTNCRRLDRMGMRSTLECRVPFLDRELTDYALSLHPAWMLRNGQRKWVLRSVAARVLPVDFAWRSKLSFARGVGYRYSAETVPTVFGAISCEDAISPEWAEAPRYPAERVFLRHFLNCGYGRARYLQARSR